MGRTPVLYVGEGAREAATAAAARLLGTEALPEGHPDLRSLVPAGGAAIGIDRVREALAWARYAPVKGDRKVILIGPAERMSPEAANALLKSLEEAPPYLAYVLFASAPDHVLPTIRSRCHLIPAASPPGLWDERLAARGYSPEERAYLLGFLDTDPDALRGFVAERRHPLREREEATAELRGLPPGELVSRFAAYRDDPIRRRVAARELLRSLPEAPVGELLAAAEGLARAGRETVLRFVAEYLHFLYSEAPAGWGGLSPGTRRALMRKLSLAKEEIEGNANLRLLAEVLLLWPKLGS